ncbi:MAG TPA: hypothetical protein PKV16_04810 [Caldisericia bacterium]|mgnify:CR=1 FL=1|nr:hypothetical protein [Caldisericia bacterium]HPF48632.1 hypothetical protein [Caldisericia bacterium]HPI83708.1 hypothetical protein [Caldisericia bacterium]HPQ93087.1 hypothetical protein [Caldisericia bacterium]HRV75080.1 hypothetical protein [Caldisericia bacterium]
MKSSRAVKWILAVAVVLVLLFLAVYLFGFAENDTKKEEILLTKAEFGKEIVDSEDFIQTVSFSFFAKNESGDLALVGYGIADEDEENHTVNFFTAPKDKQNGVGDKICDETKGEEFWNEWLNFVGATGEDNEMPVLDKSSNEPGMYANYSFFDSTSKPDVVIRLNFGIDDKQAKLSFSDLNNFESTQSRTDNRNNSFFEASIVDYEHMHGETTETQTPYDGLCINMFTSDGRWYGLGGDGIQDYWGTTDFDNPHMTEQIEEGIALGWSKEEVEDIILQMWFDKYYGTEESVP